MTKAASDSLTNREAQIMSLLWKNGPSTAAQIRDALPCELHNATVRTILRLLEEKGHVRRTSAGVRGKAFVYRAVTKQAIAEGTAVRTLLRRFFGGSAEALVARLVDDEYITPETLANIKKPVARPRKSRRRRSRAR